MRVLVVDDDLPTIELMRLTLNAFGHSVLTATNVVDALILLATDRPHIVLSDLTFSAADGPEQDGYALARAVRANQAHAEVGLVAISGITSPSEVQAALDSGFDEVVLKPFDIESLIQRITELGPESRRF